MGLADMFWRTKKPAPLDHTTMVGLQFDLKQKALVELEGFKLYVMPTDYVGHSIQQAKSWEPHVSGLVRRVLKPGDVVLDVGANLGFFTMLAATLVGETGKAIAVEPNPQNQQLIYASIVANGFKNVRVLPYAASDTTSILSFFTVGSNGGVATGRAPEQQEHLLVPSVVLDEVLQNEPRIDLVKIDIEAHEPFALRGMSRLIEKHRPKIITEFHPWAMKRYNLGEPADYLHQIMNFGYRIAIIEASGNIKDAASADDILAHYRSLNEETIQLDLYCEPKG